jgi:hypothetical protein
MEGLKYLFDPLSRVPLGEKSAGLNEMQSEKMWSTQFSGKLILSRKWH